MWKDKLNRWICVIIVFAGLSYTNIYGKMHIVPQECIEECMCQPVEKDNDMSEKEKRSYRVCGSDGVTYENLCKLVCLQCENNITLLTRYFNASEIRFAFKICNRSSETPKHWKKLFKPKPTKPTGPTTTTTSTTPEPTPPPPPPPPPEPPYTGPPTTSTTLAPWVCDSVQKDIINWGLGVKSLKNLTYPLTMVHLGKCEKTEEKKDKRSLSYSAEIRATCEERCFCPKYATKKYVCGTNGQTYSSRCWMRCDSCKKQIVIKVAHHGKCHHNNRITMLESD